MNENVALVGWDGMGMRLLTRMVHKGAVINSLPLGLIPSVIRG